MNIYFFIFYDCYTTEETLLYTEETLLYTEETLLYNRGNVAI